MNMRRLRTTDDGFSMLEMVVAAGILLVLSAVAGIFGFQAFQKNVQREAIQTASATGYADALDIITGFEYERPIAKDAAVNARLVELSTSDFRLGYVGSTYEDLCVYAAPGDWYGGLPSGWDDDQFANTGDCESHNIIGEIENG